MLIISSYFSLAFLVIFLPITVGLYGVLPQMGRRLVLLGASYVFFWAISGKLLVYLLLATLLIHYFGLWLAEIQRRSDALVAAGEKADRRRLRRQAQTRERAVMALAFLSLMGILVTLKYAVFFTVNVNDLLQALGSTVQLTPPAFLMPIGISFYTLQATSYLFDVYRRKIPADANLLRLALFLSFFPQIMEGPICRYEQTAGQLWQAPRLTYHNLSFGLQRLLFGVMKKLVIADRLNLFVRTVFQGYENYDGFVIAVAVVCYTIQLYMDFSGTMDLVMGTGEIFGVTLPENFRRPFFSKSISEFWQRWHITLGTWFKDYVFYPLSMAKPMKKLTSRARKVMGNHFGPLVAGSIALFCVWLGNGLWHGAGWHYIFFGMYHFALILLENLFDPFALRAAQALGISRSALPYRWMQIARTAVLVCIGELFFRANGLWAGLAMFRKIFTDFQLTTLWDHSILSLGLDKYDVLVLGVSLILLFVLALFQEEKGFRLRQALAQRSLAVRWLCYYGLILFVVIFGAYGAGYLPVDPMYASF